MVRSVAAIPALALLAGSAVGLSVPEVSEVLGVSLLLTSAVAALCAWRASNALVVGIASSCAFLIGGALLSAAAWADAWRPPLRLAFEELARGQRAQAAREGRRPPEDDEAFAIVTGTLRSDAAVTSAGVSISLAVDSIAPSVVSGFPGLSLGEGSRTRKSRSNPVDAALPRGRPAGGLQATIVGSLAADRIGEWRAGRRVRVPLQLHRPSRYLDPDVPDYERALARRGTTLVGTAKSGALVELIGRGSRIDELAAAARAFARRAIARAVGSWSSQSAAIVAAIVIGDRAGLDDGLQRRLQEAGTYHVIAISGGNIAILAGLMLAAFRVAGMPGRMAMLSAIAVLVAYARLVGGGASVDRATLMAVVYFGARLIDQRSPPLNTIAFVAACLIAAQPLSAADPAFVLTFGATLAILLMVPAVLAWSLPRPVTKLPLKPPSDGPVSQSGESSLLGLIRSDIGLRRCLVPVAAMLAASIAAELMLMPVGALVFARVTFAGLALNFAAIPLMAIVQIAGMALVLVSLVSPGGADVLGAVAHFAAAGLIRTAELVRYVPALSFRVAPPAWWVVVAYYGALVVLLIWWRRARVRRVAIGVTAGAAIWIVAQPWTLAAARGDGRLHVVFLDVGQGDSALVRFPRGRTLLVDAGGLVGPSTFDIGDRVVAPVLRAAGIRRLDFIALTHGDPDHIGGAASIIREFAPRHVWEGVPVPPHEPLRALRAEAQAVRATWANLRTGDRIVVDDVEVMVRGPDVPDWERQRVRNDDSIVLELRWRDVSVLLTGDIGKAVERTLAPSIPAAPTRIVQVPHHGSLTSSTEDFVRALAPRIAVVSAGRANDFGHPVPEVLERYRRAGAEVFRTDQDGAVSVASDGHSVSVTTFTGRTFFTR